MLIPCLRRIQFLSWGIWDWNAWTNINCREFIIFVDVLNLGSGLDISSNFLKRNSSSTIVSVRKGWKVKCRSAITFAVDLWSSGNSVLLLEVWSEMSSRYRFQLLLVNHLRFWWHGCQVWNGLFFSIKSCWFSLSDTRRIKLLSSRSIFGRCFVWALSVDIYVRNHLFISAKSSGIRSWFSPIWKEVPILYIYIRVRIICACSVCVPST